MPHGRHGTKQKRLMKKTKNKNRDAQKKRTSHKAVESVLRPEGSFFKTLLNTLAAQELNR